MGYASQSGRARTSVKNPQAHAICDRCGFRYNLVNLRFQFDWAGPTMVNKRLMVCNKCYDTPQEQKRSIVIPADPLPVANPRIERYAADETDFLTLSTNTTDAKTGLTILNSTSVTTEDGTYITKQPLGNPRGLQNAAITNLQTETIYNVLLPVVSLIANGTNTVTVTVTSIGTIAVNSQISVSASANKLADGFYSVISVIGNQFTYQTNSAITSGSLLLGSTTIRTAKVGLPLNYPQIPSTGPV